MPKDKRSTAPLYERGTATQRFWVDWDRKKDGSLRSPYLAIFWYDPARGRERSASARTTELSAAADRCDAIYLRETKGVTTCPTCGRPYAGDGGVLLSTAIANYNTTVSDLRPSGEAMKTRLGHVLGYVGTLPNPLIYCHDVDEAWVQGFRDWAIEQPIISTGGTERPRSAGTVEASVRQLAAAINHDKAAGGAKFTALRPKDVSLTPLHRSDVAELARMFAYCVDPQAKAGETLSADESKRKIRERSSLLRYLQLAVSTLGRPDALLDFSVDPRRAQWLASRAVIVLNPKGRRQTKKYRATVKAPRQLVPILVEAAAELARHKGKREIATNQVVYFVGPKSIRRAWDSMSADLGLPKEGEAGTKLIRRSMAVLLRDRGVSKDERDLQMGHAQEGGIGDTYAPFDPDYLRKATAAIELLIDEIEVLVPAGAYRTDTGLGADVIELRRA